MRLTSTDYANPYRPGLVRVFNRLGSGPGITAEGIVREARKKARFDGERDDYLEPLRILTESIESEANLNALGRMIIRGRLVGALTSRFKAEKMVRDNPAILNQELASPVIITGLQRTGTTLLHRLMAVDHRFRSIASWEVLNPVPPKNIGERNRRIRSTRIAEKGAAWLAPDFFAVHPIDHKAPEEDVLLLDYSFRSTTAEAILRVPGYSSWLENSDSTPAYEFMKILLLCLQFSDPRPFWLLKTPHHMEYLPVILKVFPDARIIQTHRDPAKTMGSFTSMAAHAYGMFTDHPDPAEIGEHWYRKCRRMVRLTRETRKNLSAESEKNRFLDIQFQNLMENPLEELRRIYDFAGLEFTAETSENGAAFLGKNGRHRYGKHVYSLDSFGLNRDQIHRDFHEYMNEYGVPIE